MSGARLSLGQPHGFQDFASEFVAAGRRSAVRRVAVWGAVCREACRLFAVVRASGTFGYRSRGSSFEFVAGSILVGYPGDEYVCTHDHARGDGDECLSFHLTPALVEAVGDRPAAWRRGC